MCRWKNSDLSGDFIFRLFCCRGGGVYSEVMKKAVIYVFSGTGNTRLIADLYKQNLTEYETTVYDVKMKKNVSAVSGKTFFEFEPFPDPREFDLVGFGHPVYGFNIPKPFDDFINLLPALGTKSEKVKKAFVFKTSGEGLYINEFSSQRLIAKMEKKGFEFVSDRHYVMPYNMIFRHTPEMVKREWLYASAYAKLSCMEIQQGKADKVHINPVLRFWVPLVRIEWLYYPLSAPFSLKVDLEKCIKCQKCVKSCPLNNISFNGNEFKFGNNCTMCTSCSFGCPTSAISIGLLNGWKINGSYSIKKTAENKKVESPEIGKDYSGLHPWLYKKYYRRIDKKLISAGIEL